MEDKKLCAAQDYEAMYVRAMDENRKLNEENRYLHEELKQSHAEMKWHHGFRAAVELIFGKGGFNE